MDSGRLRWLDKGRSAEVVDIPGGRHQTADDAFDPFGAGRIVSDHGVPFGAGEQQRQRDDGACAVLAGGTVHQDGTGCLTDGP